MALDTVWKLEEKEKELDEEKKELDEEKKKLDEKEKKLDEKEKELDEEKKELEERSVPSTDARWQSLVEARRGLVEARRGLAEARRGLAADKEGLREARNGLKAARETLMAAQQGRKRARKDDEDQKDQGADNAPLKRQRQYIGTLEKLPPPRSLGSTWPVYQQRTDPQGQPDPIFNCHRPCTAKGPPAALMCKAFGEFLDRAASCAPDAATCAATISMIKLMSPSYKNMNTKVARNTTRNAPGPGDKRDEGGEKGPGGEDERKRHVNRTLGDMFREHYPGMPNFQPSVTMVGSKSETDGSIRADDVNHDLIGHPLMSEVKEDLAGSGESNPEMQLVAGFAKSATDSFNRQNKAVRETCFPSAGLVVVGNVFRVAAMYYAGGSICYEPLTPFLQFADLRLQVPGHTEAVARALHALSELVNSLLKFYKPYKQDNKAQKDAPRDAHVEAGIPYPLIDRFTAAASFEKLGGRPHVFLCSKGDEKWVAKFVERSRPYPEALHREMAGHGLAPQLEGVTDIPGGFAMVVMDYLAPEDGWKQVESYNGDGTALKQAMDKIRRTLASCLGGAAVHGDLRGCNIMYKLQGDQLEVKVIDWDWAGRAGEVRYPMFMNKDIKWPLEDPTGQPIEQDHDAEMLANIVEEHGA